MLFDNENSHMNGQDASVEIIDTTSGGGAGNGPEMMRHPQDEPSAPRNNQVEDENTEDHPMIEEYKQEDGEEENGSWEATTTVRMFSILNESDKP
jgi:hypothetical protein